MQLENEFTVPVPVSRAWPALLDVQRTAPCLPGASVERVDGDEVTGRMKVALGPLTMSYAGTARFVEKDEGARRLVMEASGRETRGGGTASATVDTRLIEEGSSTRVRVLTDLNVTGRPAQFGRGIMADVAGNLMDQFAACVADQVRGSAAVPPTSPEGSWSTPGANHGPPSRAAELGSSEHAASSASTAAIDLLGAIGPPVMKRVAPVLAGLAVGVALCGLLSRRPRVVVIARPSDVARGTPIDGWQPRRHASSA